MTQLLIGWQSGLLLVEPSVVSVTLKWEMPGTCAKNARRLRGLARKHQSACQGLKLAQGSWLVLSLWGSLLPRKARPAFSVGAQGCGLHTTP